MKDIKFKILSNNKLADNTYEMVLGCEAGVNGVNRPGQFVNIKLDS